MDVYGDYAYYYNVFYNDKNYVEEASQVDYLIKKYGNNIHNIINFGCGTGKHDIAFCDLGYRCTGIDISPAMIEIAKKEAFEKNQKINYLVEDIRKYRTDCKFDGVVSLFHVMSYQKNNKDILNAFFAARNSLHKDGIFIFDIWYGPGVLSDKPCVRVKEVEDDRNRLIRIARPVMHDSEDTVDVNYEILIIDKNSGSTKMVNETHIMRYFFRPELEFLLSQAGFILIDNVDCRSLSETDYNSWTSYIIAKAI